MRRRLKLLGFATYDDYLASPLWAANKERWYRQHTKRPQCHVCAKRSKLHLHHCTYERLGAEAAGDLVILCAGCHMKVHAFVKAGECKLLTAHTYLKSLRGAGIVKAKPTRVVRAKRSGRRSRIR